MHGVNLISVIVFLIATSVDAEYYDLNNAESLFEVFVKDYDRHYKDNDDRDLHFKAFVNNLEATNKANAEDLESTYGITQFADFTPDEFKNFMDSTLQACQEP
ncbi:unnamed protein product [Arctia plantaginis]|uniref:Cathepsin propeptide inhibitor domain-containing protein n=1 Tax=Arctia plantaginis TaxID=874455 RepID=A0A8S0ZFR3_ARCPL|nr:unnamed protein product [Arctia plantaginis]CAB3229979.1 unnamed protein product [Arctia plantaginis]